MSLWTELKRRKVVQAAIVYAVPAWVLVQVIVTVQEPLGLPSWLDTVVILLVAVGFPVTLFVSWVFELTPEGLRRTSRQKSEGPTGAEAEKSGAMVPSMTDDQKSIAVLPFENLSPNPRDAYFAAGLHEEILNQLAKLKSLTVIARTTMRRYVDTSKSIPEIADELNVRAVMEGSVRYSDARVRVTAQLIDGRTGGHLWSETYEREFKDVFDIESDVARNVANSLKAELSLSEQASIDQPATVSPEAYALYLSAVAHGHRDTPDDMQSAVDRLERALQLDPRFVAAWLLKASAHATNLALFPKRSIEERAAAEEAISRVLELEPENPIAHRLRALLMAGRGEWIEAERTFARAHASGSIAPGTSFGLFKGCVAHCQSSIEALSNARESDPLNATNYMGLIIERDAVGDAGGSLDEYARGRRMFDRWESGNRSAFITLLGNNDVARAIELARAELTHPVHVNLLKKSTDENAALAELEAMYGDDEYADSMSRLNIAIWAAHYGAHDLAMSALRDTIGIFAMEAMHLWRPLFREVRRQPAFKELLHRNGFVVYWDAFGWPEHCGRSESGDFECR